MKKRAEKIEKYMAEGGFTLLEVIMAISILTAGLLAVASMQISAIQGNSLAGQLTTGTSIAQDKMEELLSLPYTLLVTHPDLVNNTDNGGPHFESSPPDGFDFVQWDVTDDTPETGTKTITVTVAWHERGAQKTTSLSSFKTRF